MAIRSSNGFSPIRPGHFTFLYRHTKHNIHNLEGGEKENKKRRTWVSSKRKKGDVCNSLHSFLCICELSRACTQAKFPQGTLTHPLTLVNPTSGTTGPCSRLSRSSDSSDFCWLLSPSDCPVLSTAFFCSANCLLLLAASFCLLLWPCLPLSSFDLVGNLALKPFVWVSRQNRQNDPLTGTHTDTHRNECHPSCHNSKAFDSHQY